MFGERALDRTTEWPARWLCDFDLWPCGFLRRINDGFYGYLLVYFGFDVCDAYSWIFGIDIDIDRYSVELIANDEWNTKPDATITGER